MEPIAATPDHDDNASQTSQEQRIEWLEENFSEVYSLQPFFKAGAPVSESALYFQTFGGGPEGGIVVLFDEETRTLVLSQDYDDYEALDASNEWVHRGVYSVKRDWFESWTVKPVRGDEVVYLYKIATESDLTAILVATEDKITELIQHEVLPGKGLMLRKAHVQFKLEAEHPPDLKWELEEEDAGEEVEDEPAKPKDYIEYLVKKATAELFAELDAKSFETFSREAKQAGFDWTFEKELARQAGVKTRKATQAFDAIVSK